MNIFEGVALSASGKFMTGFDGYDDTVSVGEGMGGSGGGGGLLNLKKINPPDTLRMRIRPRIIWVLKLIRFNYTK